LVPKPLRLWWGGLKNLLSGVTTVCHHNPYDRTFEEGFPVQVVRRYGWAHSMAFEQDVFQAFASTEPEAPFIIHAGEGTDERSQDEVFELDRIGVLTCRTIIVHGVAFSKAGHALREQRGAALVWCPTSNRFLLGTTLDITSLNSIDNIAVGSDSALTAQGNLLDEIRAARDEGTSPASIYEMVTETSASILRLSNGEGRLEAGSVANLVAIPWTRKIPAEAILETDISDVRMVMVSGVLNLASDEVIARFPASSRVELEKLNVDGVKRWVRAPIRWLIQKTTEHVGDICLAGRSVSL
jgi:cytosine/adenosine deaminase-related metal-dependent hydrolase